MGSRFEVPGKDDTLVLWEGVNFVQCEIDRNTGYKMVGDIVWSKMMV